VERSASGAARARLADVTADGNRAEWLDRDAPFDTPLTWHVAAHDARGRLLGAAATTLVRRARAAERLSIRRLHPNPSRDVVTIQWFAPRSGPARLELLDVAGRRIRTMDLGSVARGEGTTRWDGRDARGAPGAPGVYFARLTVGTETVTARGMRLR
jgi:hypothetical protein